MKKLLMRLALPAIFLYATALQAEEIYATFDVEAAQHADLAFTSSGTVDRVNVDVTSAVKKGDILAELNNDDLKAALDIAAVALKYAKRDYDRQVKVKKLVDESRFDMYAYKFENAKAKLAYQQALLDKTQLKAPFDGVIYEKSVEVGDVVSGAMIRTVMKIQSLKKRKLILEFDQKYWKKIKPGLTFKYRVDGDDAKYTGTIEKVYPYANEANRKIRAEVEAEGFTPGLFGDGYILLPDAK
ncbi:MAG TPA: efflux RND transporter periplasmic adaptor subunit [Epsilonproteobacteria bacterium]|nr:efflux RND transporter periplasmic adaptor subunit [Campylobacterota bacterium]